MLDDKMLDRIKKLISIKIDERNKILLKNISQIETSAQRRGVLLSSYTSSNIIKLFQEEVENRAGLIWDNFQRIHLAFGSEIAENDSNELKELLVSYLNENTNLLAEIMAPYQRKYNFSGNSNLEESKKYSIQKYEIEIDIYIDSLQQKGKSDRSLKAITDESKAKQLGYTALKSTDIWEKIESELGFSKKMIGLKIRFVSDSFKRKIIFRDIEHSYVLATMGYSKPSVILVGGIIEELLRLYLDYNNIKIKNGTLNKYIIACEDKNLLKKGVSSLTDSFRHFRNIVHLSNEVDKRHTISKATAKSAVASIFTISSDFIMSSTSPSK